MLQRWQRASLNVTGSFECWMAASFDTKRGKELRRLHKRLGEKGEFQTLSLAKNSEATPFNTEFMKLEVPGWKGDHGTALANHGEWDPDTREALATLHQRGKLRFWTMKLEGQPIASLFSFVDGSKTSLGKIAYDESFGRYLPGVLLVLDATNSFFADGKITEIDSSAIPIHPMIDRIWRKRITIADVLVAPAEVSASRFTATVIAEKMRRTLRAALK